MYMVLIYPENYQKYHKDRESKKDAKYVKRIIIMKICMIILLGFI